MKIILAMPGNEFRGDIMLQTIKFINYCDSKKIDVTLSMIGGSNVSIVREKCLGLKDGDLLSSNNFAPFYGKIDYDYILWVDSDIVFKPEDFEQLLSRNVDIVAGPYKKTLDLYTSTILPEDKSTIKLLQSMSDADFIGKTDLIEVLGFGFGFALIKRGVFENITRPWFATAFYTQFGNTNLVGEDIWFCFKARDAGYKLWIDPLVNIGHIKSAPLGRNT
jgi:hypothetical protein